MNTAFWIGLAVGLPVGAMLGAIACEIRDGIEHRRKLEQDKVRQDEWEERL